MAKSANSASELTIYVCGPTVYDYAHIGNARSAVVFDVLFRFKKLAYSKERIPSEAKTVKYARNITDIDDKIIDKMKETGRTLEDITSEFTKAYQEDMAALNCLEPTFQPKATDHIPDMIAMISKLIEKGHAYEAEGHILFSVESWERYGELSKRNQDSGIAGARVEVASYKKNPADFILWKPSEDDIPGWDSPWGRGRPGWHIECSVMAKKHLGDVIDIHGGGLDLIFPHHENEHAQSCCANGTEDMAREWIHNGYLQVEGKKMSKSLGNFITVRDLLDRGVRGEAIRLVLLSAHAGQPLDWTEDKLKDATAILNKLYSVKAKFNNVEPNERAAPLPSEGLNFMGLQRLDFPYVLNRDFIPLINAMNKMDVIDIYTPKNKMAPRSMLSHLNESCYLFGIGQMTPDEWFRGDIKLAMHAEGMITRRSEIKEEAMEHKKKFSDLMQQADEIRNQLKEKGIILEDTAEGTIWKKA